MPESPSEVYKRKVIKHDSRRKSLVTSPRDYISNQKAQLKAAKQKKYPYKGYYELVPAVMDRDHYTCQKCGRKGEKSIFHDRLQERNAFLREVAEEEHQAYIIEQARRELRQVEQMLKAPPKGSLMVHHIDGNKLNNTMENLVTWCRSCHTSYTRRTKTRKRSRAEKEKRQADKWRENYYRMKREGKI